MNELREKLFEGRYSCVISNNNIIRVFTQAGIKDLHELLKNEAIFLKGSSIADKVVGKAAAALMVLGGVKEVYADVISSSAISLLRNAGVSVSFSQSVPYIKNRNNTGMCPLEQMSMGKQTSNDILLVIEEFRERMLITSNI